jgi:hypothetical protein
MPQRKATRHAMLAAALVALSVIVVPLSAGNEPRLIRVPRSMLCVTEGAIEDLPGQRLSVDTPKMRAYVNRMTTQTIEANFTYAGPTATESALGSGAMRRQFGLKLRAQDPCNLVYAVWRIEPESKLVVSVKSNPGEHTSAQCGNRGYRNIKPQRSSPVPLLRPGDTHTLRAEINAASLRVFVDSSLAWEGSLGADVLNLSGPVGIRSDNVRLRIQLEVGEPAGAHPDYVVACKSGPSESE